MTQPNRETFYCNNILFRIEFIHPARNDDGTPYLGLVKNENKWQLFKASYHKHTWMRKVKRPRSQQVPRWKSLGFFDTPEAAKAEAEKVKSK